MAEITPKEAATVVKEARTKLGNDIQELINAYESETGLKVGYISLHREDREDRFYENEGKVSEVVIEGPFDI